MGQRGHRNLVRFAQGRAAPRNALRYTAAKAGMGLEAELTAGGLLDKLQGGEIYKFSFNYAAVGLWRAVPLALRWGMCPP